MVIITHKGLFCYNRLPYGISSAPGILKRTMNSLVQGIPGVVVYIDDVLITGPSNEEHLKSLEDVLKHVKEAGLKLQQNKCSFMSPSVTYLENKIDAEERHPLPEKIEAIVKDPSLTNVTQLKAYLGLLSYYSRFLPNLTFTLSPLYRLLRRNVKWKWTSKEKLAFALSKVNVLKSTRNY